MSLLRSSLFAAALLTACGDGSAPVPAADGGLPPGDAGDARSFRELCTQEETYCARLYECATPSRLALDQMAFGHDDEASCVVAMRASLGAYCELIDEGLDAGRSSVDLVRLAACVDFRDGLSCEEYVSGAPSTQPLCDGTPFVSGLVPAGGACALDVECATAGDACSSDGAALGTCGPLPGAGEACDPSSRCADGLRCEAGLCVDPSSGGCLRDSDCPDGWCDQPGNDFRVRFTDPTLRGVCAADRTIGEECDDLFACGSELHCDNTSGPDPDGYRQPGTCIVRRAAGEPCNEPADCASRSCTDDLCE